MKKYCFIAVLLLAVAGVRAQNCEAIMLPYFGNDRVKMAEYQEQAPYKFEWRCAFARAAFYESDTVPKGVEVFHISEVKNVSTKVSLTENVAIDLTKLSYYAYNFAEFQRRYPRANRAVCFTTPGSTHRYLVLRSIEEMHQLAEEMINNTSN